MKIAIQIPQHQHEKELHIALGSTIEKLGHSVYSFTGNSMQRDCDLHIVWNGKTWPHKCKTLYTELGWLPRWWYQLSYTGINGDHDLKGTYQFKELSIQEEKLVRRHITYIKHESARKWNYCKTNQPTPKDLPPKFLLCPTQVPGDLNMKHVAKELRIPQGFVSYLNKVDLDIPIVYKGHPASDSVKFVDGFRSIDSFRPYDVNESVHSFLKDKRCIGIITLNSNTVHDAILWHKPSIALGGHVWGDAEDLPIYPGMPKTIEDFEAWYHDLVKCKKWNHIIHSYIMWLRDIQWSIDNTRDAHKVARLLSRGKIIKELRKRRSLSTTIKQPSIHSRKKVSSDTIKINVVAKKMGWLFEDIQRQFADCTGVQNVDVTSTSDPDYNADAWIYLRPLEAKGTPDPNRTIVQWHDLFTEQERFTSISMCRGLSLVHPEQYAILNNFQIQLDKKKILFRPIGALNIFKPKPSSSNNPRVGWFGRPSNRNGVDIKRFMMFVQICNSVSNHIPKLEVILAGQGFGPFLSKFKRGINVTVYDKNNTSIRKYPDIYSSLRCTVVTSRMEAGPLSLFESLACGIPVVTSECGWASRYIVNGVNGYIWKTPDVAVKHICHIINNKNRWSQKSNEISSTMTAGSMEGWICDNLVLAKKLVIE